MKHRMTIAVLSAISCMVALYLHMWKIGMMGALTCGAAHGCEIAQFSSYGYFLGIDVALIGTVGYALIVIASIIGAQERWVDARWPTLVLMALIFPAVLFTVRLKYGEFVVLKTFCPWCAISAVTITLDAIIVTLDWRRVRAAVQAG